MEKILELVERKKPFEYGGILEQNFFKRDCKTIARDLLGKEISRGYSGGGAGMVVFINYGIIIKASAYEGNGPQEGLSFAPGRICINDSELSMGTERKRKSSIVTIDALAIPSFAIVGSRKIEVREKPKIIFSENMQDFHEQFDTYKGIENNEPVYDTTAHERHSELGEYCYDALREGFRITSYKEDITNLFGGIKEIGKNKAPNCIGTYTLDSLVSS
ncbi:hypothetical protein ACFLZZ_02950 [Nanoarchaeota archaeon]